MLEHSLHEQQVSGPAPVDLFAKIDRFTLARQAQAEGWYPFFIPFADTEGTEVVWEGRRLIMIGSNNYLGLTADPRVRAAAAEALARYGPSCTGSRFLNGNLALHEELERALAEFVGKQAALVFSTGFQANLGAIGALIGRSDVAIADRDVHASLLEGCQASFGQTRRFQHNDIQDLERVLRACPPRAGKLVIVDGLYSMGGDLAPLPAIARLCQAYGARLLVDDAHALGVLGGGRGTAAHFGLSGEVDLITGTFSKSLASLGGFVAGDERVIHYIKHFARSFIFSASITPASAAAALAALRILRDEPEHCVRVNRIGERMRAEYRRLGFEIGASVSPIVPIIIGDDRAAIAFWRGLFEAGIYANAVIPPACPPNAARLRTSYMATHSDEQLDRVLDAVERVGRAAGIL